MSTAARPTPPSEPRLSVAVSSLSSLHLQPDTAEHSTLGELWTGRYEQTRADLYSGRCSFVPNHIRRRRLAVALFATCIGLAITFGAHLALVVR